MTRTLAFAERPGYGRGIVAAHADLLNAWLLEWTISIADSLPPRHHPRSAAGASRPRAAYSPRKSTALSPRARRVSGAMGSPKAHQDGQRAPIRMVSAR
jgi:hypothetical protein